MAYIGNTVQTVPFITDTFSGTGAQTAFTPLTRAPAGSASIAVFIAGVYQAPSTYTLSGVTITFVSAPTAGAGNIIVLHLGNGSATQVPSDGSVTVSKLSSDVYGYINAAFAVANSDSGVANSGASYANSAFLRANTPSATANSAASYANSAFSSANTSTITGDRIGLNAIRGNNIVAGTITGNLIATNQITGNLLTDNCVSGNNIISLGTPTSGNLSSCTADGTNKVGYRTIPPVGTKTGSYTLAVGDVGEYVQVGSGGAITIPNATFVEGDIISIFNNTTGSITITCSITTAYIAGTDTDKATMTLATRGLATILFISGTVCVVSGNVT
jgi:hypothetical protein